MTCQRERPKFLAAVLGAAVLAAWSIPAFAETVRVRNIRVSEASGDTAVVIAASARPTFTTWKLEQPARVVVELSGARLGNVDVPMDAGTYAVGLVSASVTEDDSAGPRTRIVLTLRQASDYRVEAKGNDITLRVVPRVRPPVAAQAVTEAQIKAEGRARAEAQTRAETQTKLATQARAEAEASMEAQRKTEARLQEEAKERLAAEARVEERSRAAATARLEAERLRKDLAEAQKEATRARAEASVATQESQHQKLALGQAEARAKQAQIEADRARKRAETAEGEAATARVQVQDRDKALQVAAQELDTRQKALDRIASRQKEQQIKLDSVARLASERESTVRASEARLAELAAAERQHEATVQAAEKSRQDLARAVSSRRQEEARKDEQAKGRREEEARLDQTVALRKAEELRLANARRECSKLEDERVKLEDEHARLESARQALLAEVKQLKTTMPPSAVPAATPAPSVAPRVATVVPAAKSASAANPVRTEPKTTAIPQPTKSRTAEGKAVAVASTSQGPKQPPVIASRSADSKPVTATGDSGRPHSITLRARSRIRAIDFVDEPSRASVIIDIDDNASFAVERVAGRRLSLRIEHSDLPDSLERNLDATEYLGPVKVISSYRDPAARSTVRIDVDLAEYVPNHVRLEGNRIFWDFQKTPIKSPSLPAVLFVPSRKVAGFIAMANEGVWVAQVAPPPYLVPPGQGSPAGPSATGAEPTSASPGTAPQPAASAQDSRQGAAAPSGSRSGTLGKKRYVGRRIDLDFKGADIHNILRLLADVGQVNVIVADDVRGEVTIKMRDVPWDQALDVVLRSKALGSVREGNLLRVAPLPLLEKELEAEIARQKQIAEVLPTETRLIGVSYAEAGNLTDKARDLLTPRGKISVDSRTNTLIVTDVVKSLQLVEDLVRNLDTQTSQVVIEARIVEANTNFARQIGVQWGGSAFADTTHGNPTGLVFPYNVGIGGGADDGQSPLGGLVPAPRSGTGTSTSSPNFLVNMPAAAGMGTGSAIGLTMGSVAGAFNLNLRLSAYESTGHIRVLSSPRITTMDNVEANIDQGVSIPVSTVSAMGAQTQFVDAKLHLGVKPHVTNEGTISLVVNVTRNEPDFVNTGARGDPSIQKKEARTTMLVRDGDTAVIGGIYTRNTGLSNARVPFFSDIPVLGWFFRNKKENDNRSEFLVFITPRIVNRSRTLGQ